MTDTTSTALTVIETPTDMMAELSIEQARAMVTLLQDGIKHAEEWHLTAKSAVNYTLEVGDVKQQHVMHISITPYKVK